MKIVIDSGIPYIKGVFEDACDVIYMPGNLIKNEHLVDADALIVRTRTKCNRELLEGTTVKIICSATIGYDHIDTEYCDEKSIEWHTVPGCNAGSVAQYVLSSIVLYCKNEKLLFNELKVGVIGYGNVGKMVVHYLHALGIKTLINDPVLQEKDATFQSQSLDLLLDQSNVISIHTPLTYSGSYPTYHLANNDFFSAIKNNALFINSSRGEVVDEEALLKMFLNNRKVSVVLDVWEHEPAISKMLLDYCMISTPHIAGYSADGKYNGTIGCIDKICTFFEIPSLISRANHPLPPQRSIIEVDALNRSKEDLFAEIIDSIYQVSVDSFLLKENFKNFEFIRNNYPNRREFKAYALKILGTPTFDTTPFFTLGFKS